MTLRTEAGASPSDGDFGMLAGRFGARPGLGERDTRGTASLTTGLFLGEDLRTRVTTYGPMDRRLSQTTGSNDHLQSHNTNRRSEQDCFEDPNVSISLDDVSSCDGSVCASVRVHDSNDPSEFVVGNIVFPISDE